MEYDLEFSVLALHCLTLNVSYLGEVQVLKQELGDGGACQGGAMRVLHHRI